jgi:hypothetical protein
MTVEIFIPVLLAGFLGGMVRGVVGYIKHQYKFKNVKFDPGYFIGMSVLSGITGFMIAAAVENAGIGVLGIDRLSPGLAFIAGYAGGDFIEGIYEIIFKKVPFMKA